MTGTPPPFKPSIVEHANVEYATGQKNLSSGNPEIALTWFRRAALSDPNFFSAHMQVGLICRDKAKLDKMFLRYAYDAFHKAAGLDLSNEDAHNQFILAASESQRLDELLIAYEKWTASDPGNVILQRCKKNVITLGMAMIPQSVDMATSDSGGLKRFVLVSSILLFVVGLAMLTITPMLIKTKKITSENVRGVAPIGMAMAAFGMIGFVSRRYL